MALKNTKRMDRGAFEASCAIYHACIAKGMSDAQAMKASDDYLKARDEDDGSRVEYDERKATEYDR